MTMVSFPAGYRCGEDLRREYPKHERDLLPVIRRKAGCITRWSTYMDVDDAIQEGRITLLRCLTNYDEQKADGNLKKYVAKALDNTYADMFWRAVAQCRMPRGYVRDADGGWAQVKAPPMSLDQMLAAADGDHSRRGHQAALDSGDPTPEDEVVATHLDEEARRFRMKLLNILSGRDKEVFENKFNPSTALLKACDNLGYEIDEDNPEVPNIAVAKYMGISKNQVDHCLYKIRQAFKQLAKDADFSDLFGELTTVKGWPMIFVSDYRGHNKEFVRRILKERNLDPVPLKGWDSEPDHFMQSPEGSRWVERYSWGMVIVLKKGDEWRTLICEGDRINLDYGFVFGVANGCNIQEEIGDYVPWYKTLVKKLKKEAKHGKRA